MDLINLWLQWADGSTVSNQLLWGYSVLFWGRLGKILQFLGACAVIVEVIGPERIRSYASSLPVDRLARFASQELARAALYKKWLMYYRSQEHGTLEKEFGVLMARSHIGRGFDVVFSFFLLISTWFSVWCFTPVWLFILLVAPIFFLIITTALPLLAILRSMTARTAWLVSFLLTQIILKPLAKLLDRPSLDRWFKALALLFVIVGFHFDLLAS